MLAKREYNLRGRDLAEKDAQFIPFSAQTRMSGVDLNGRRIRKGAADQVIKFVRESGGQAPTELAGIVERIARSGGTPLVVADNAQILGVIHLKDIIKEGIRERFARLRAMGLRTVMITGDNPLTAAAIAHEAGVDDFRAEATPETKLALIRDEQARRQAGGHDRRRHQRRAGTGSGRRRDRDERRHPGRARSRQHG